MSGRVDRVAQAQGLLDMVESRPITPDEAAISVAAAQVHATLALVEQQRIANRLAVSALVADDQRFYGQYGVSGNLTGPQGVFTIDFDGLPVLDDDIREGLGS